MKNTNKLSKFIHYVLALYPDEFGLVLDQNGFVKIKTLLQAMHEDTEWRFLRRSHLNELTYNCTPSPIVINGNQIRSTDISTIPHPTPLDTAIPKLLYVPIRQRNYLATTTYGISPSNDLPHIVLSRNIEMAHRIGRRIDNTPIIITVKTLESQSLGVSFSCYGRHLFLSGQLPAQGLICPSLTKTIVPKPKGRKTSEPKRDQTPGSFLLDPDLYSSRRLESETAKRKKDINWKKDRRKARKNKDTLQNIDS